MSLGPGFVVRGVSSRGWDLTSSLMPRSHFRSTLKLLLERALPATGAHTNVREGRVAFDPVCEGYDMTPQNALQLRLFEKKAPLYQEMWNKTVKYLPRAGHKS